MKLFMISLLLSIAYSTFNTFDDYIEGNCEKRQGTMIFSNNIKHAGQLKNGKFMGRYNDILVLDETNQCFIIKDKTNEQTIVLSKYILSICKKAIKEQLGGLSDLPHELANTVANIYYKFFELGEDMKSADGSENWIPSKFRKELLAEDYDSITAYEKFIQYYSYVIHHYELINNLIPNLRLIDPELYDYTVELTLDITKYKIDKAHKKSAFRRRIERKRRIRDVDEIPNLIDLMNL